MPDDDVRPGSECVDHQQQLRGERGHATDDGNHAKVKALPQSRKHAAGDHGNSNHRDEEVVLARDGRPVGEKRGHDGAARHAGALVSCGVNGGGNHGEGEDSQCQSGRLLLDDLLLPLLGRHEHDCHQDEGEDGEAQREPDRIKVVSAVDRVEHEGHHDERAHRGADHTHAQDAAHEEVALRALEELAKVDLGHTHCVAEEVVPEYAEREEVVRPGPDARSVDHEVADDAHEEAELHGDLAADDVAEAAEDERAGRRAQLAEGPHEVHREREADGRRARPGAPLALEGVRGDVLLDDRLPGRLLLGSRAREGHAHDRVHRAALSVGAQSGQRRQRDGGAKNVDEYREACHSHHNVLEALVGAEPDLLGGERLPDIVYRRYFRLSHEREAAVDSKSNSYPPLSVLS
mmetsp:Transcript_90868/g.266049  ORF Transcript_90868/g.266049 Transcript_90868/m.266049 type:complete len:405 (+) Transcript_90868:1198-2412(+)